MLTNKCVQIRRSFYFLTVNMLFLCAGMLEAAEPAPVKSLLEIRQDKVVIQKWDLSCGAATLATLLAYQLNDPVPEQEVAKSLVQREEYIDAPWLVRARHGFSLLDLKRYVDSRGYTGIGFGRLTVKDLDKYAPVIVPIDVKGYNHFVIYRGTSGNRVLLADPAWGQRTLTIEQFERAWIEFPEFGKVGFVVADGTGNYYPNNLEPKPGDFVILK